MKQTKRWPEQMLLPEYPSLRFLSFFLLRLRLVNFGSLLWLNVSFFAGIVVNEQEKFPRKDHLYL
jgi:hypothetical protein